MTDYNYIIWIFSVFTVYPHFILVQIYPYVRSMLKTTKRTISRLDTSAKLSISLRLREVVQILVREVLNWQVKPWENIRSFLNTCGFKSLFTFTSYFRSLFSPFWLSTERQLLSTNLQTATQNIASCSQQFTNPRTLWFFIVLYKSGSFSFFIHIYDEQQQGSIMKLCQWQVVHDNDIDFPELKWDR